MVTFDAFFDSNPDHESSFINPPDVLLESEILFGDFTLQIVGPMAISVADQEVFEGDSGQAPMVFSVSLASPAAEVVTVQYTTANGSATTADNDYVATSGTLTFQVGQQVQPVTVLVNGDTNPELNETFNLVLSDPVNGTLSDGVAVGTNACHHERERSRRIQRQSRFRLRREPFRGGRAAHRGGIRHCRRQRHHRQQ
jgi:hypothetical protein